MQLTTFGPVDAQDLAAAVRDARDRLSSPLQLVLVYAPIDGDHAAALAEVVALCDAPVLGATTGGAAFTERGITEDGYVGGLLSGDVDIQVALVDDVGTDTNAKVRSAVDAMKTPDDARPHHSILALMDAFAADGEALIDGLRGCTPPHWGLFGGTAGDRWRFASTQVFFNDRVVSGAAVLAHFSSSRPLAFGVRHGWRAADDAATFEVTAIDGNVLRELDGRPAVDVYRAELQRLGLLTPDEPLVQQTARFELGAHTVFGDELKIRAPLGLNDDGSITLASSLQLRDRVQVVVAERDDLIRAAGALADSAKDVTGGVGGMLVFDCAARHQLLQERYVEQVKAFARGNAATPAFHPLLGFACYGEIARASGSLEGFHNTTAVCAAWANDS